MDSRIRVLAVGAGNTGRAHILAYHRLPEFEIVGICTRSPESRQKIIEELDHSYPGFNNFQEALAVTRPDAVSISAYTETHYPYTKAALEAGCHVFVEKPLAETLEQAEELVELARTRGKQLLVGYILRHHPGWSAFVDKAKTLGQPIVMRMNLNQQSTGAEWETHKAILKTSSPVVDCGVHYVDLMSEMTGARPIRVSGIGARLSDEIAEDQINYAHLQVTYDDGSVGWYEAGWGPMMSETAFFVKDVIGPKGAVSIVAENAAARGQSANVDAHAESEGLYIHPVGEDADAYLRFEENLTHDQLFQREQEFFLKAIKDKLDLQPMLTSVIDSMRIVLAADESFHTGKTVELR